MATKPKRPRDTNQLAKLIVDISTGEVDDTRTELTGKKADSSKGGLKGGKTRMEMITAAQRSELGKKAALARWKTTAPSEKTGAVKSKSTKQN